MIPAIRKKSFFEVKGMRNKTRMSTCALLVTTLLMLGVFSAQLATVNAPALQDTLVILHPHSADFADSVIEDFKVWYQEETGNSIGVSTIMKYSGDCYAQVELWNGTAPEADIWWGGGVFYFDLAKDGDLLEGYTVADDASIDDEYG